MALHQAFTEPGGELVVRCGDALQELLRRGAFVQHPGLLRVSDVINAWDVWVVTNPEARNNTRVRSVKDALVELLDAASDRPSGRNARGT